MEQLTEERSWTEMVTDHSNTAMPITHNDEDTYRCYGNTLGLPSTMPYQTYMTEASGTQQMAYHNDYRLGLDLHNDGHVQSTDWPQYAIGNQSLSTPTQPQIQPPQPILSSYPEERNWSLWNVSPDVFQQAPFQQTGQSDIELDRTSSAWETASLDFPILQQESTDFNDDYSGSGVLPPHCLHAHIAQHGFHPTRTEQLATESRPARTKRNEANPCGAQKISIETLRRQSASKISTENVRVLEDHFTKSPYPSRQNIADLARLTGLKENSVRNWFRNTRYRRDLHGASDDSHTQYNGHPKQTTPPHSSFRSPCLSQYLGAPMSEEAASPTDVCAAVCTAQTSLSSPQQTHPAASHSASSVSQDTSSGSTGSQWPTGSRVTRTRRKGRRRFNPYREASRAARDDASPPDATKPGAFFCTFGCSPLLNFRNKYDWRRHEESVHVNPTVWICLADDNGRTPLEACPFCAASNPSDEHLDFHAYFSCLRKLIADRTFTRKDHLKQHLRRVHAVPSSSFSPAQKAHLKNLVSAWARPSRNMREGSPALSCGFCEAGFGVWEERVDHVAAHFKAGAHMESWVGRKAE